MSSDRDSTATFYSHALKQAAELDTHELRRHANVGLVCGCKSCFCCACLDALAPRDAEELKAFNEARRVKFEAQYAKAQAEKEEDRKRMGLE